MEARGKAQTGCQRAAQKQLPPDAPPGPAPATAARGGEREGSWPWRLAAKTWADRRR